MFRGAAWVATGVGVLSLIWSGAVVAQQQTGTRASGFGYDAVSGLLIREVVEPDLSQYRLQTDYGYDAFGNKTAVTVSGADITTRSASTGYDARGQFALSSTNALNQSESFTYDPRFGLPLTHAGPNGLTTSWQYDGFGRKLLEIRPDGTRTRWSYRYCAGTAGGTDACPTGAVSLIEVKVLASNDATLIAPVSKTYKDQLGRDIAGDTQGFDGATIRGLTEFDALGRQKRKSRPFFLSGGSPLWTSTDYDVLSRLVLVTEPDNTTSSTSYSGLTTIGTNALGQTKTVIKDSQGQQVSVTDAEGNTATFGYDPFGNLARAVDPQGNVTVNSYDRRGRKIATQDPDMGAWSYRYNVLDQVVSQTDAKGQTVTQAYDLLGRPVQRIEPDLTSTWTYDTAAMGIGKPATASTNGGYARSHSYDALGRPTATQITIDGVSHTSTIGYDAVSRPSTLLYPSGLQVTYGYNALGYQTQLSNSNTGQVYWTANARDAELRLIQQTSGNGVVTTQAYDTLTGDLKSIKAGPGNAVQDFGFGHDLIGNITSRTDANTGLSEAFTYDSLNRLRTATVGLDVAKTVTYDTIGNIRSKSDVGTYSYPVAGQPFPHAVSSVAGSVINTSFSYDANGNQTGGNGLAITYASFNKPATITRGTTTIGFNHDPEHQRYKQVAPGKEVLYLTAGGVLVEKVSGAGGSVTWNNYLFVAGKMVGMRVERADGSVQTRYFHRDHLGSVAILTDEAGNVAERLSYDAWGKRRFPNGQDDPAGSLTSQTTRGFTGHEQLDDVGLVHMNGRVYDPLLGRFGTPDPMTENPFSTQGWNRYSYVGNSPLNFIDPSGYCWAGCFWQKPFKALGKLFNKIPILGQILTLAASYLICGPGGSICAAAVSSLTSAFVAGVRSGSLGQALKAGLISAATAAAMFGVGQITGHGVQTFGSADHLANIAGHAAVGCLSAVASGGKCGPGALSGAVGSFSGPLIAEMGLNYEGRLIASSVVGGVASVAGGGKFGDGAVTAAFGYMFNEAGALNEEDQGYAVKLYGDGELYNSSIFSDGFNVTTLDPEYWIAAVIAGPARALASLFGAALRNLCSFQGDTQVFTDHGFVAIKDIKAFEYKVWSRNPDSSDAGWKPVLAQYSNPYKHTVTIKIRDRETGDEQTIVSNRIHPFFVQLSGRDLTLQLAAIGTDDTSLVVSSEGHVYRGSIADGYWIDAAKLKPGYRLLNDDESWAEVVSVEIVEKPLTAYNITVADWETFFVRGATNDNADPVWVHNCNSSRIKNYFREMPEAEGAPHTVFRRDNNGNISAYETYNYPSPGSGKRVDLTGPAHNGVPTPHVTETTKHINPSNPSKFGFQEGPARPARSDEIPGGIR